MKITKEAIVTSPFDACANVHDDERMSTNEPYATWDDVPDDLKPAAEESDREDAFAYLYYNVGSYHGDNNYTEEQWRCARKLYLEEHAQQDSKQKFDGLKVGAKVTIKKDLERDSRIGDFAGLEVTITSVFTIGGRVAFSFWHSFLGLGAATSAAINPEQKPADLILDCCMSRLTQGGGDE